MADYSRCLRPEFTKQVFEELQLGRSLNLFGPKGSGRTRLLEDIQQLALGAGIKVIRANLKEFQFNYRGFLKDMEWQMALPKPGIKLLMQENANAPIEYLPGITTLQEHYRGEKDERVFLLFDDFDAVVGNPNHEFPKEFFNDLNSLKRNARCTLCCVTLESHSGKKIYYDGGRKHSSSWLELTPLDIPPLKRSEISEALRKRLQGNDYWNNEPAKERLITAILARPKNKVWYLLQLLAEDYTYHHDGKNTYKKRLNRCLHNLKKRYPEGKWWKTLTWEGFKREIKELLGIAKDGKALLTAKNENKE